MKSYIVTATTITNKRYSCKVKANTPIGAFIEAYTGKTEDEFLNSIKEEIILITIVANIDCNNVEDINRLEVAAITKREFELLNEILEGEEV